MTSEAQDDLEEKVQPKEFSKITRFCIRTRCQVQLLKFDSQGFVVELKNGKVVPFEWRNMVAESVELQEDAALEKLIKQVAFDIAKNEREQVTTLGDKLDYDSACKRSGNHDVHES